MKRVLMVAMVALMTIACVFANGQAEVKDGGLKERPVVYYCAPRAGGVAWNQSKIGFEQACKDYNIDGQFLTPMDAFNNIQIVDNMNIALNNGADCVLFGGGSVDVFGSIVTELQEAGILVGSLGNYAPFVDYNVAATFEMRGQTYFDECLAAVPEDQEINILFLSTQAGEQASQQMAQIEASCKANPRANLVNFDFVGGDAIQGSDKMAANISAYPQINVVICADATGAMGVGTWVKENGREDLFILTEANSPDVLLYVNEGYIDECVYWEYTDMGYKAAEIAYKWLAKGEKVGLDNDPGYSKITKENVKQYATEKGIQVAF